MSEEVIEEGLEVETPEPEQQEAPRASREDWQRKQEEKASANGWKDFDDYVADGGDPTQWKTADAYNIYGELVSKMIKDRRDFDSRLQNVQKLSEVQVEAMRAELQKRRDDAIENGDKDAVKAVDNQLNKLNQPAPQQAPVELQEWNERNPWIFEDSAKSDRAKSVFTRTLQGGASITEAIRAVDATIAKEFSAPRKPAHIPESEKGKGSAGFKSKSDAVTMESLTSEEALAWKHMPQAWDNDPKKFLQSVADMRKAAAKGAR